VTDILSGVHGVERVLTREQAAKEFRLMPSMIGELVAIGDKDTVFGELDAAEEHFPGLRSHGSLHETEIPLFVYAKNAPPADYFNHNLDLARWLYPSKQVRG
jgi:phosphonoacetate hydrolase